MEEKSFSEKVASIMRKKGLKYPEMAKQFTKKTKMRMTPQQLSNIVGRNNPNPASVERVAIALGVPVSELE